MWQRGVAHAAGLGLAVGAAGANPDLDLVVETQGIVQLGLAPGSVLAMLGCANLFP
ncbi:hypothetical protein ACFOHT_01930 [Massilia oculi]|uniref:hypothetical protein n=1 Tax=Massilia oculi TaxID=945844 RepID=UPI0026D2F572